MLHCQTQSRAPLPNKEPGAFDKDHGGFEYLTPLSEKSQLWTQKLYVIAGRSHLENLNIWRSRLTWSIRQREAGKTKTRADKQRYVVDEEIRSENIWFFCNRIGRIMQTPYREWLLRIMLLMVAENSWCELNLWTIHNLYLWDWGHEELYIRVYIYNVLECAYFEWNFLFAKNSCCECAFLTNSLFI